MKKLKKRFTAIVSGLLIAGCGTVLAAESYSFYFSEPGDVRYSANYVKTVEASGAFLQQTGCSPGTYLTQYTVFKTYGGAQMTLSQSFDGSDRAQHILSYYDAYKNAGGIGTQLQGKGLKRDYTVNGIWNPNG